MKAEQLRKLFIQITIGALIASAALAVVVVLVGSFNDVFARALVTLGLVMFHALVSVAYLDEISKKTANNLKFFNNVVFTVIVLSFLTSIFGTWEVLSVSIVTKLYATYGITLFASLHGETLMQLTGKQANIDKIVYANYVFMVLVILLLLPIIWLWGTELNGFYYRVTAAAGIIDATLTILATILYKMYLQKHPEVKSTIFSVVAKMDPNGNPIPVKATVQSRRMHPLLWILVIYLVSQVVLSLIFAVASNFK